MMVSQRPRPHWSLLLLLHYVYADSPSTHNEVIASVLANLSPADQDLLQPITSRWNASRWSAQGVELQSLLDSAQNDSAAQCAALNLASSECYDDCVYYNSIPAIMSLTGDKLEYFVTLYAMGGNPVGYSDVGNPDMCQFAGGTYCSLPAIKDTANKNAYLYHACCVPGSCSGSDAVNVLHDNAYCWQSFQDALPILADQFYGEGTSTTLHTHDICEPLPRDLARAGPWVVVSIFALFVLAVFAASVTRQYRLEYRGEDAAEVDAGNMFVAAFSLDKIWGSFRRTRPPDKSSLNFLDGIRVISMLWVR